MHRVVRDSPVWIEWYNYSLSPLKLGLGLVLYILIIALVALNVGRVFSFHLTLEVYTCRQGYSILGSSILGSPATILRCA